LAKIVGAPCCYYGSLVRINHTRAVPGGIAATWPYPAPYADTILGRIGPRATRIVGFFVSAMGM